MRELSGPAHSEASFTVTKECPGGFIRRFTTTTTMNLYIAGSLGNGRRMQGDMPPDRFSDTTLTGSWDFQGR